MNTILFDLDGTLLPMDQDLFTLEYFKRLSRHFAPLGFDVKTFAQTVTEGSYAMYQNDGTMTNEERFWKFFSGAYGKDMRTYEADFMNFYENEFQTVIETTTPNQQVKHIIELLKSKNYRLVLATNPLFPPVATHSRIRWAGLSPSDFIHITTYDNSTYCKPNLNYYTEILSTLGLTAGDCLMVGNDVTEDMGVKELGIETYLITDCLINKKSVPLSEFTHGTLKDFEIFVENLPALISL